MGRITVTARSLKKLRETLEDSRLRPISDLREALTKSDLTKIISGVLMVEELHHGDIDGLAAAITEKVWKYVKPE